MWPWEAPVLDLMGLVLPPATLQMRKSRLRGREDKVRGMSRHSGKALRCQLTLLVHCIDKHVETKWASLGTCANCLETRTWLFSLDV